MGAPGAGTADTFSGFNVNAIALEVPISELIGPNGNTVLDAYASTSRPKVSVIRKNGDRQNSARFVQVERIGNPLVNELVIATNMKDRWNATDAEDERDFVSFYCNSALATALNAVFGTGFPTTSREDLVNVLLRCVPGPSVCGSGKTNEALADFLRVDLDVPATPVLRLTQGEDTSTAIFSRDSPTQNFSISEQSRWTESMQFVHEGIWHIWLGFDHVLIPTGSLASRSFDPSGGALASSWYVSIGVLECRQHHHGLYLGPLPDVEFGCTGYHPASVSLDGIGDCRLNRVRRDR